MKYTLLTLILLLNTSLCFAENADSTENDNDHQVVSAEALGLSSPRDTFSTFLHSMNDIKRGQPEKINKAISTLDLSAINPLVRDEKGRDLAWMLLEAIDKTRIVKLENIPDNKSGAPYVFAQYKNDTISIVKSYNDRWLFSQETLSSLPNIIDQLASKKTLKVEDQNAQFIPWHIQFRRQLPDTLKTRSFLLENWKWLGVLLSIALGVIADKVAAFSLQLMVLNFRRKTKTPAFKEAPEDMLRPLAMLAMAAIWWAGLNLLALPEQAMVILLVAVKVLAGIAGVWGAYRLVDFVTLYLHYQASKTDNKVDDVLVPLIRKTLKVFVTVIGITFIASNLNLNVSSLLASLGLGGLAFALAAKDVVQNLFGSITVILDQTFHNGDWIVVNDIEGSVEEVGLRSTKIRTFYDSLITLPNAIFINAKVDNMGQRRYRRLSCNVALTYDTPPDKIEAFCEGVREIIRLHPYMRKDYFHVYLNSLGASSLDVLVYVFWETPDWSTELRERQRFLLDILRLAKAQHVDIAFPTQTLHLLTPNDVADNSKESKAVPSDSSINTLSEQFKRSAKDIVSQSIDPDNKPPPVKF
ncbi:mechanosensitive ion channel family protein [Cycloclasticus pugetii]|uniref:mechanosensitive ion channel family protein n=1 Tax=Cycloclasticus pugetii TaxID=34068 RepID=UPI000924505C|nr:mechanosensitive ion channel family protein [Cycloclasticus pugetii]SHJ52397.1 MscS family membrane protein [Cycloclasticus pugetii]